MKSRTKVKNVSENDTMDKFIIKKSRCGKDCNGEHEGKNVCESVTFGAVDKQNRHC
jgi:hypothetical protein